MEYTFSALISVIVVLVADRLSGIRLAGRLTFWISLGVMYLFMIPVNGYLTARPIVLYASEHQLGLRILTMPVEDFFFGFSAMTTTLLFYEYFKKKQAGQ
ncbi:MAG: lycopene cyclase domain-containing protein [Ignavibacteria bacterium]|nr:lycopene cyclase domain-containing protein [Ignavibacteria bacterium]